MRKYIVWIVALVALTGLLCLSAAAEPAVSTGTAVAVVGTNEFSVLEDAFAAYNANSKAESIKLLADVPSLDWVLTKDTVLDLNGFTVTGDKNKRVYVTFGVESALAIMDTSEGQTGKIIGKADGENGGIAVHCAAVGQFQTS